MILNTDKESKSGTLLIGEQATSNLPRVKHGASRARCPPWAEPRHIHVQKDANEGVQRAHDSMMKIDLFGFLVFSLGDMRRLLMLPSSQKRAAQNDVLDSGFPASRGPALVKLRPQRPFEF